MMKTLLALGTILMLGTAMAHDTGCTDEDVITVASPAGTYYVDNDQCQPDCLFSLWVYQESNGHEGLQRCDEVYDECWNCNDGECWSCSYEESDTIIF